MKLLWLLWLFVFLPAISRVIASPYPVTEAPTTTTMERTKTVYDMMLMPKSCEKVTCVFRNMGIISDTGIIDIDAYTKMLHNFTELYPAWSEATSKVLTTCVSKPVRTYDTGCDINNMLTCTLDVLTENCSHVKRSNVCIRAKHDKVPCQISSSKNGPKNRRELCLPPELIRLNNLLECDFESLFIFKQAAEPPEIMNRGWFTNRYSDDKWAALLEIYTSAFINMSVFGEQLRGKIKI